jgi:hypothetical protein
MVNSLGVKMKVGQVNSSVRFALGMDIYYSQAHRAMANMK